METANDLTPEERKLVDLKCKLLEVEIRKAEREERFILAQPQAAGEFTLVGVVEESMVHQLIHNMSIWAKNHPKKPVSLVINSAGGAVIDGFALFDFLTHLKRKGHLITTVGLGMQASMGGVLLQVGDERVMSKRSWMLVHEVQGIVAGSLGEMEDDMKFNEALQDQVLDILATRSKWTKRQIKNKWKRRDCWLNADQALAAGLIDRIEED